MEFKKKGGRGCAKPKRKAKCMFAEQCRAEYCMPAKSRVQSAGAAVHADTLMAAGKGGRSGEERGRKRVEEVRADSNSFVFLESPLRKGLDHGRLCSACSSL